LHPNLDTEFL